MATNVAASANGATASASSTFGAGYEAARANNGNRTGATAGVDGYWNDGTVSTFDDWLQIDFSGSNSINEIDVFGVQDAYTSPTTPTLTMTSALYGLKDFDVQYWTGTSWATVAGGAVTGNNHVWTQFTFSPVTTTKIRVLIHNTQDALYSRVVELEAWTAPSVPSSPSSPSPANAATGVALALTLSWVATGATLYDVYFGTAASPPLVSTNQSVATYVVAGLSSSTTYHWKIVAKNSGGSTTGSVWAFTTGAFSSTGSSIMPNRLVEVELSGVGLGWTDITADVLRSYGINLRTGIQGGGPADLVASAGTARFGLNNSERNSATTLGYYSRFNTSKRSGWDIGINCRIRFQDPNTGTYYTRFIGRIDSIVPLPGVHGPRAVEVTVADWLEEAALWPLTPDIGEQVGQRGDEILTAILAQMPRQPTATSFDPTVERYLFALDQHGTGQQTALAELGNLARSELGYIFVKGDGTLRFEGRHARLLDTSSDWTLTDADEAALDIPTDRTDILNTIRVTVHSRIEDEFPTTLVYEQATPVLVRAGETKELIGPYRDPITGNPTGATDLQSQVSGVDFIANTNTDGSGADLTSNFSVVVQSGGSDARFTVTNSGLSSGYLTVNRIFGKGLRDQGTIQSEAIDSLSVDDNGVRAMTFDMPYQSDANIGQAVANYRLAKYASVIPWAKRVEVAVRTSTQLAQALARDISDRLTISETVTGLNASYFINGIDWRLTRNGHVRVTYTLAPAYDPFSGNYWVLGTSTLGTNTIPAPI